MTAQLINMRIYAKTASRKENMIVIVLVFFQIMMAGDYYFVDVVMNNLQRRRLYVKHIWKLLRLQIKPLIRKILLDLELTSTKHLKFYSV